MRASERERERGRERERETDRQTEGGEILFCVLLFRYK